jgi:hypothetical protein
VAVSNAKRGTLLRHVICGLGRFGRNPAMSPFCFLRFGSWVGELWLEKWAMGRWAAR